MLKADFHMWQFLETSKILKLENMDNTQSKDIDGVTVFLGFFGNIQLLLLSLHC